MNQDIRIYVPYSRPNDWTEWAEIFRGVLKAKKKSKFFY